MVLYMTIALELSVLPGDALPIYRQIMQQLRAAIASRRLEPGAQLPSQRELATRLVISPLTVMKAYNELEREGLIRTARGRGSFVSKGIPPRSIAQRRKRVRCIARQFVTQARLSGLSTSDTVDLVKQLAWELDDEQRAEEEDKRWA